MRNVVLSMQVSLDGFIARPKGELDCILWMGNSMNMLKIC